MFGRKKEIEINIKLKEIEKEKEELIKIKELLDNQSPKIDISDIYVWEVDGISYIVKSCVKPIRMACMLSCGRMVNGFHSQLIDIFNNKIVYEKQSLNKIDYREFITEKQDFALLTPINEADKSLLVYVDKMVPLYVLQQTYYKLNNIDVTKVNTL